MLFNQFTIANRLLAAFHPEHFAEFSPHLELVELPVKHILVEADIPTTHVCFLASGLGSMVATSGDDETVEIGHIGHEGMAGAHILLMTDRTPNRTFMQVAGSGYLMPTEVLIDIVHRHLPVQQLLLNYVHSCELQLAQSALANARYSVYERLARWLLMVHDRMDDDDLPLTHEFLSLMLGVRRSGVTDQIHLLEGIRAIKATRGNIQIRNRPQLESIAGGCYGIPEREYQRLIGLPISLRHRR